MNPNTLTLPFPPIIVDVVADREDIDEQGAFFIRGQIESPDNSKSNLYLSLPVVSSSDYECGNVQVPIEQLTKIADFFDVSLDYLAGRKWPKKKSKRKTQGSGI